MSFAIITDLFQLEVRGRVMGFVQMAFGASQVLGLPIGLLLANNFGWHSPFWMIAIFGIGVGIVIAFYMKPVNEHLKLQNSHNAVQHLVNTISKTDYLRAFLATVLLATGGFMLMPFGSAFSTNNLGLTLQQLPILYLVTGIFSLILGPFIGRFSDKIGKFKMFSIGTVVGIIMIAIYTNLGVTPIWGCMILNVLLFAGINARMISASALTSAIPQPRDRGAFMSINSSIQQISGGVATFVAGLIVVQTPSGFLARYDVLGYTVIGTMVVAVGLIYWLDRHLKKQNLMVEKRT